MEKSESAKYRFGYERIALILIVVIGITARLYDARYSLDWDESFSVKLASKGFSEMFSETLQDSPHPPLYNILLYLWMNAFGESELKVRLLSVLFSGLFLLLSYALLRRFLVPWIALGVLSLFALSPLFVLLGQQARPYSLITLLTAFNLLSFMRVMEAPIERRRIAIWAVSCCLLLYAQYLGLGLIAIQMLCAIYYLRAQRMTILASGLAASALILPWFIAAMASAILNRSDPLPQISWLMPPTPTYFASYYISLFGNSQFLHPRWLLLTLGILGAAYIARLVSIKKIPAEHALLFLTGFGLPIVAFGASLLGPKPVFLIRQFLGVGIAVFAILGLCLSSLPKRLAGVFLLGLLLWIGTSHPFNDRSRATPPWREIAAQIDGQYGSITVATTELYVKWALYYYRKQGTVRLWKELPKHEIDNRLLFVCHQCSEIGNEAIRSRGALLSEWRPGSPDENKDPFVRLYEIKP